MIERVTAEQDDRDDDEVDRDSVSSFEGGAETDGWTAGLVEERLRAAIIIVQRTERRPGPKSFGRAWPDYQHDWEDLLAQQEKADEDKAEDAHDRNRVRLNFTSAQVTAAEQALGWPALYIPHEQVRRALCIWMFAKAMRVRSWQKLAQRRGMNKETAKARKAKAIQLIISGLSADGVVPRGAGR